VYVLSVIKMTNIKVKHLGDGEFDTSPPRCSGNVIRFGRIKIEFFFEYISFCFRRLARSLLDLQANLCKVDDMQRCYFEL
jgi:hypothetical protein